MYHGVAMKRTSAVFVTLGLILILALLIPLANVSAATYYKTLDTYSRTGGSKYFTNATPLAPVTESVSWISISRSSLYAFSITVAANTGDARSATVKLVDGSKTMYYTVKQAAGRFLVHFYANGGTGGPGTQYKSYSSSITISSTVPTRTGYTFLGWSASSTATTATYLPGKTYSTVSSANLYAVWQERPKCTVTLWGNGGRIGTANVEIATYQVYQNDAFVLNITTGSRSGYTFQGFATEALATTATYPPSPYTRILISQNLRLYAIWKANNYTLTFNANGGSCSESSRQVAYGASIGTLPTPTRSGYTFNGWYTASSGGTKVSSATTMGAANQTIYAQWQRNVCTVTLWGNGGTLDANNAEIANYQVDQNDAFILNTTAHRTGYTFQGFATEALATTISYSPSPYTRILISQNLRLYAIWKANNYTLTFNANGGSCSESSRQVAYGASIGTLPTPTRSGYTFQGWYTSTTYETKVSNLTTMGAANRTIYAKWERNVCTVTLWGNGGRIGTDNVEIATYQVYQNDAFVLNITTGERSGYTFQGFATEALATTISYTPSPYTSITISEDLDLYAVWKKLDLCTIIFDANGGVLEDGASSESYSCTVERNTSIVMNMTASMPGYTFLGWAFEYDAKEPDPNFSSNTLNPNRTYQVSTSQTFYAVWACTVTLDANGEGAVVDGYSERTQDFLIQPNKCGGQSFKLNTKASWLNHVFVGWSEDPNAETASWNPSHYTNVTVSGKMTLYAVWDRNPALICSNAEKILDLPNDDIDIDGKFKVTLSGEPNTLYRVHIDHPTDDNEWVRIPISLSLPFCLIGNEGNVQTDSKGEATFEITYDKLGSGTPSTEYRTADLLVTKLKADNTLDTRHSCTYELRHYGKEMQTAISPESMFDEQPQYAASWGLSGNGYNGYPSDWCLLQDSRVSMPMKFGVWSKEAFIPSDGGDFILEISNKIKCLQTGEEEDLELSFKTKYEKQPEEGTEWIHVSKLNDRDNYNRLYVRVDFYREPSMEDLDPFFPYRIGEVIIGMGDGHEYRITIKQYPLTRISGQISSDYWDKINDDDRGYFTGSINTNGKIIQKKLTDEIYYAVRSYNLNGYYFVDYIFYERTVQGINKLESWGLEIVQLNGENSYIFNSTEEFDWSIDDYIESETVYIMDS